RPPRLHVRRTGGSRVRELAVDDDPPRCAGDTRSGHEVLEDAIDVVERGAQLRAAIPIPEPWRIRFERGASGLCGGSKSERADQGKRDDDVDSAHGAYFTPIVVEDPACAGDRPD